MEHIVRKGIAFDPVQLEEFDMLIKKRGYKNRSEAIRDCLRKELIKEKQADDNSHMMASLTIVYDHHAHDVQHNITHHQHHHADIIRSTLHVHLNKTDCMEVIILEGKVHDIKHFADGILAQKGVKHGELVLTSA